MSQSRESSTTYNNSHLNANTMVINARGDATIERATLHGTEEVNLEVAGDLVMASLQDREKSKTLGLNADMGVGNDHSVSNGSLNADSTKKNYRAVNEQTAITGGTINVNVQGNSHLVGAKIDAQNEEGSSFSTGTLTTEDISNRADYLSMSGGVGYSATEDKENNVAQGVTPNVGMPTQADKSSTTKTAISQNIQINITDKENQTQDINTISRDTESAHYQMTEINTEILDIRKNLASEVSQAGFEVVGDIAMAQAEGNSDEA
ncbi:MAG TPA: hypothetical protein ENK94_04475, partial [Campylobacterales bacterium]|nr:hypothetical protein [Campylobacterales bacterium]